MCIPPKRRPVKWKAKRGRPVLARKEDYRQRYTVERSFAWLGNFRRLLIRWERTFALYRGLFTVGLALICLKRLLPVERTRGQEAVATNRSARGGAA